MPGVGISIGLTRLFSQLKMLDIIKSSTTTTTQVLVIPFIEDLSTPLKIATELREHNINTEVYLEQTKIKKKLDYANKKGIPYAIIIGEDEIKQNSVTLKNMTTGEQTKGSLLDIIKHISPH